VLDRNLADVGSVREVAVRQQVLGPLAGDAAKGWGSYLAMGLSI
jgi:hypothetical protein